MLGSPAVRLSIALTLLTLNLLFLSNMMGLIPNETKRTLALRKNMTEALALQFSSAAANGEYRTIQHTLQDVVNLNENIRSAAIRTLDGKLIAVTGEHLAHWRAPNDGKSTATHVLVPIYRKNKNWARVEIRYAPLWKESVNLGFTNSFLGLLLFVSLAGFLCYFFVLKRALRELDPSSVVPERVQRAFDVLREGVLILDDKEQIVMANKSISKLIGKSPGSLIGLKGSEIEWMDGQQSGKHTQLPWVDVISGEQEHLAGSLEIKTADGRKIKMTINVAKVVDNAGKCRGCLVTFDDITQMEEKNFELSHLVDQLRQSEEQIRSKTQELEFLASQDPLTFCLNRRALDKGLTAMFSEAKTGSTHLTCLMVDIDHFKLVNDRYGHATGDQVIKAVADVLRVNTRDGDIVGRYGGEEFCVIISGMDIKGARKIAERIRKAIATKECAGLRVTVSIGVSSLEMKAAKPDELVNQADKALYAAKKGGRNRVCMWGVSDAQETTADDETPASGQIPLQTSVLPHDDSDPAQLKSRILELEGLLEKHRAESDHYQMYDIQTGFPTRKLFEDRVSREIARSKRTDHLVAVLSIAIDTVERVEKTLGQSAAMQLIQACGDRLNDVLRQKIDTLTVTSSAEQVASVSLINQTELGILFADIEQVDHMTWIIKRLLDTFKTPLQVQGEKIYVGAYIGVGLYPNDGHTVEALCASASNACNYAKQEKANERYRFASKEINSAAMHQLQIEYSLYRAIEDDELQLHFQPLIKSATGRITGFEALLRWRSAKLGPVSPGEFIPVAEQSGQILKIGDWVLSQACRQLRAWLDAGLDIQYVAVNLSALQLQQPDLVHRIASILKEYDLQPHHLEIELTESSFINFRDQSFGMLKQIKKSGIRVAMDDFGTGYSSLAYLRNIPLAIIKIDRSFIDGIGMDDQADQLVSSIVSMAHRLGLEVVAEGVEVSRQADFLISLGCEYLQGYFFGKPVPPEEVDRLAGLREPVFQSKMAS